MDKLIGKVTHFFDKAMVAVILLDDKVSTGDTIKFKKIGEEFEQKVESMQIDHKQINSAKKGEEIAIKVDQAVKEGAEVHLAE
ncbi:MAG: hypothetical protein PHC85_03015 [Candidatus Pacebacteria bacterium]|nr:hypothetical protein [Candidatus Paceibacterota bacterium]